jgi:heat shock protein HtpX
MATLSPTFRDLIAENKRNSVLLVVVFCLFTAVIAMVLGLAIVASFDEEAVTHLRWKEGLLAGGLAAGVAFLFSLGGYFAGDSLILATSGAHRIHHKDDPELFNVVEEMAIAAGLPTPQVYLIDDPALNAFATGRDPKHASIAITSGLRHKLTRDELQGVLAHEMSHIRNYDIRLMLLMAVLVGTVVMLSDFFWQILRSGGGRSKSSSGSGGKSDGGGLIVLVLLVIATLLALIAPLLAQIIQFAVSRQREYLADATAVQLTRYPQGLANALRKLRGEAAVVKSANRGIAHLFIANPIEKYQAKADSPFASHPPLEDRIARLEALVHKAK